MTRPSRLVASLALASVALHGCAVGPNYKRPSAPTPPAFKEDAPPGQRPEDWKPAEPRDAVARGPWWEVFGDPALDALEEQVDLANQDVARAEANYRVARALARGARGEYLPTVTAGAGVTISHNGNRSTNGTVPGSGSSRTTSYQIPLDLTWEADLFGRIRRNVEANVAEAQATAADLESVRLTLHAELATDWFLLKGLDAERRLLDEAIDSFTRALELTRARHGQGLVSGVDVAQAETQLEAARVDATDLGIGRAQLEHAIAVLVGKPPAEFAIPPSPLDLSAPAIPAMLPAELLERRPDIAAAERRVAAANADIGVAQAAFFPTINLSAAGNSSASSLGNLFTASANTWSLGLTAAQTLFDAGARKARVEQARASYDASVADYRQTALTAFEDVENQLTAAQVLERRQTLLKTSSDAADQTEQMLLNQYKAGQVAYTDVVSAQASALSARRALVTAAVARQTTAVALIQALGGGWTV
jgi:NodT family efflux transporter outer membrane factor (OMF) lipoprotein